MHQLSLYKCVAVGDTEWWPNCAYPLSYPGNAFKRINFGKRPGFLSFEKRKRSQLIELPTRWVKRHWPDRDYSDHKTETGCFIFRFQLVSFLISVAARHRNHWKVLIIYIFFLISENDLECFLPVQWLFSWSCQCWVGSEVPLCAWGRWQESENCLPELNESQVPLPRTYNNQLYKLLVCVSYWFNMLLIST